MLSDEEKKALKELTEIKELVEEDLKYKDYEVAATLDQIDLESLVIVLNLIEKQSKEIEELKDKCKELIFEKQELTSALLDSTPDDKIKAKIEELDEKIKVKKEIAKNPMDRVSGRLLTDNIVELEKTKKVLQLLLEKE